MDKQGIFVAGVATWRNRERFLLALFLVACAGWSTAAWCASAGEPLSGVDRGEGSAARPVSRLRHGFRRDPMAFIASDRSVQSAMVRTFLLGQPVKGDERVLAERIDAILATQNKDGTFGADAGSRSLVTARTLLELVELGASVERAGMEKAAESVLCDPTLAVDGQLPSYAIEALCLMGRSQAPILTDSVKRYLDESDDWLAPEKGSPWTPAMPLRALWAARHLDPRVEDLVSQGLKGVADRLNDAGCLGDKDPWGFTDCAGAVNLPEARRLLEKQIPMILRAQQADGGWGDRSFKVFRALLTHGLLEPYRSLPPLPQDWQIVREIPSPGGDLFEMTWDGQRLWLWDYRKRQAVAVSPVDGKVLKRLELDLPQACGIAWWNGALVVTQTDPKKLLRVDADSGKILQQIPLDDMGDILGVTPVEDEFWVGDGFHCGVTIIPSARPDQRRRLTLAGPGPIGLAAQGPAVWHFDFWAPAIIKSDSAGRLLDWGEKPLDSRCNGLAWDGQQLWALDKVTRRICAIRKAPWAEWDRPLPTVRREGARVWIDGVPAPQGKNSVLAALSSVLQALGEGASYEYLMGVSGHAFRLQFNWSGSAPNALVGFNTADEALKAMGYTRVEYPVALASAQAGTRTGEVPSGDGQAPARQAIRAAIDAGRPGIMEWEEAVPLVGYEETADGLTGLLLRSVGEEPYCEPAKDLPLKVHLVGAGDPPPLRRQSVGASLATAISLAKAGRYGGYPCGLAAWNLWIDGLNDDAAVATWTEEQWRSAAAGNAWTYFSLIEARDIAAGYLRTIASDFGPEAESHLVAAATFFDHVVGDLKQGIKYVRYPSQMKEAGQWTRPMRRGQSRALEAALANERRALARIEKALDAEGISPTVLAPDVSAVSVRLPPVAVVAVPTPAVTQPQPPPDDRVQREGDAVSVAGVDPLVYGEGRPSSFVAAVTAVAHAAGLKDTYEHLMGVSAAAFRLFVTDRGPSRLAWDAMIGFDHSVLLWEALGFSKDLMVPDSRAAAGELPFRQSVAARIDAGSPMVSFGLDGDYQYGVIAGYADNGRVFLCRLMGTVGETYTRTESLPSFAVALGSRRPAPTRRESLLKALSAAVELAETREYVVFGDRYASGFAAYEAWMQHLVDAAVFETMDQPALQQAMDDDAVSLACLLNARAAAAGYLQAMADELGTDSGARLAGAAKRYASLAGILREHGAKNAGAAGGNPEGAGWAAAQRNREAKLLANCLALERQAVEEIRSFLSREGALTKTER